MIGGIQQYWKDVKLLEDGLPEFVSLVAIAAGANPFVTQVAASIAAKLLHAQSHRVATGEEVAANRANDLATLQQAKQDSKRRSGAAVVVVENPPKSEPTPPRLR